MANHTASRDVMIDLETLGTGPDAPILTIGAMLFDRRKSPQDPSQGEPEGCFYARVQLDPKVTVDSDTMMWWMKQEPEARYEAFHCDKRLPLKNVLTTFVDWCKTNHVQYPWSHGAGFDCVIVDRHLRQLGLEVPWSFWNIRDTRTLYDLGGINANRDLPSAKKHNALYDCYRQIIGVNMAYRKLKL